MTDGRREAIRRQRATRAAAGYLEICEHAERIALVGFAPQLDELRNRFAVDSSGEP